MDTFPPAAQRPALLSLASAINSRPAALRRDECGDWHILGQHGHIYAAPEGFQLIAETGSPRLWSAAKTRLPFCAVTRDGDDEGVFILARVPTPIEAEAIRRVLGIKKRKTMSPEHLEKLRAGLRSSEMAQAIRLAA